MKFIFILKITVTTHNKYTMMQTEVKNNIIKFRVCNCKTRNFTDLMIQVIFKYPRFFYISGSKPVQTIRYPLFCSQSPLISSSHIAYRYFSTGKLHLIPHSSYPFSCPLADIYQEDKSLKNI